MMTSRAAGAATRTVVAIVLSIPAEPMPIKAIMPSIFRITAALNHPSPTPAALIQTRRVLARSKLISGSRQSAWTIPRKDFQVQYYDGSTWHTVATYTVGTDFENNVFYNKKVTIDESSYIFPTDMKIRFVCDASNDRDDVYIDEVSVSAKVIMILN